MDFKFLRTSLFTEEQAERLVDEHNYYRRFQNASDMEMMIWDQDLGKFCITAMKLTDYFSGCGSRMGREL